MSADVLVRRLTRRGFAVELAADGAEGVRMARERKPALVLMDLSLPVLDGLSAARALRDDPVTRDIPIVMLTGHAKDDSPGAHAEVADAWEEKPIDLPRLLATIESLLGEGRRSRTGGT
jgi:CheY-like chemotaxis protein